MLTETSIARLYMASLIPGILLALLFMLLIALICVARPGFAGNHVDSSWRRRIAGLPDLLPPLIIFILVVGTIYAGVATPTESAAFGVLISLALAAAKGRLSLSMLREAVEGTMRTTAMVMAIVVASILLNFVLGFMGISREIASMVLALELSPVMIMIFIAVFYVILGCFMESYSIIILTVPILAPIVSQLGFDLIWFGVVLVLLLETALITPPVGLNLYVVQAIRRRGQIVDVITGAAPFVGVLFLMVLVLLALPELALWLPDHVYE